MKQTVAFSQSFGSKLAIHRASVPLSSLLLFTGHYGPVNCNYNVIQHISALSRR